MVKCGGSALVSAGPTKLFWLEVETVEFFRGNEEERNGAILESTRNGSGRELHNAACRIAHTHAASAPPAHMRMAAVAAQRVRWVRV